MNLLRIQDALKNASDQQLMALMQAPDSTAPSYLVLSEIRRRKDMRAKQAPQEGSNRTVAEDLTAPQEPVGIQGLQGQDSIDPDGVDAADGGVQGMAAGGLASLRRYRDGGVVRMQVGGSPPTSPLIPMGADLERDLAQRAAAAQREGAAQRAASANQSQSRFVTDAMADVRAQIEAGVPVQDAINSTLNAPSYRGRVTREQLPLSIFNPPSPNINIDPEPGFGEINAGAGYGEAFGNEPGPSGIQYDSPIGPERPAQRGGQQGQPGQGQQGQGQPRPAGGGGGGGGAPAGAGGAEAGLPTMADIYRQNQGLFADGIAALRERAQQERVDPAARRNEAVNMALIEAGLRIAGSRNPSLVGAIGEGALPAVQSYGQQLGQIRAEQREARRDELELAKQELNRQFAVGQISATEYRTRMDNITRTNIADRQERAASARAAEAENRLDQRAQIQARLQADDLRRRGYYTPEEFAALSPQQQAVVREQRSMGRPADTAGAGTVLNATVAEIGRIRTEMDADPAPRPTSSGYAEWQRRDTERRERLRQAEQRRNLYESIVVGGRAPGGGTAPGGGQGSGISQFGG
jgi:hypothetical protein